MEFHKLQDFAKLLSCTDVAAQYEVSRNTVLLHCKSGKIKDCVLTRRGYLIDPDAPAAFWPRRAGK